MEIVYLCKVYMYVIQQHSAGLTDYMADKYDFHNLLNKDSYNIQRSTF